MSMRKESGFTLIETVIALALLTLLGAAFLMVSDAGRRLLEIGRRLEKLDDEAARAVRAGEGRPTGKELRLQFWKEGEDNEENVIWEVLREYEVEAEEEGQKVRMYYYR